MNPPPADPRLRAAVEHVERFVDAFRRKDWDVARPMFVPDPSGKSGFQEVHHDGNVRHEIRDAAMQGDFAVITLWMSCPSQEPPEMQLPMVVVDPAGDPLIDMNKSMDLMFGGSLQEVAQQLGSAMAGAMEGLGRGIADAMSQAFESPPVGEDVAALPATGDERPDIYRTAQTHADRIETALREMGAWEIERPSDDAIDAGSPFGMGEMAFEQWIKYVLLERVRDIIATGGSFPGSSHVGDHATREFDGRTDTNALVRALRDFDDFINTR